MGAIIKLIIEFVFLGLELVIGIGAAIIQAIIDWINGG